MARYLRLTGLLAPLVVVVLLASNDLALAGDGPPPLAVLSPGDVGAIVLPLQVNVVFVGYRADQIDTARFRSVLSPATLAVARLPLFLGLLRSTGVGWFFDYRITFSSSGFEDAFFGFLLDQGQEAPLTGAQVKYNSEPARTLVVEHNLAVDADLTEQWLAANGQTLLGIDTTKPTIFFINWFGRPDFRFHVYVKTGEPDPDTGFDWGLVDSRTLIAWGGTPGDGPGSSRPRVWFHDLSAGPNEMTLNWDLTRPDVDGDGVPDYRIPPVWEYGNFAAYRPFNDLTGDLARIARFVAVDMFFAPSPLFNPVISAPKLPSHIDITLNSFIRRGGPAFPLSPAYIQAALSRLQPWNTFTVSERRHLLQGRIAEVHRCFLSALSQPFLTGGGSCYGQRGGGFAIWDLFLYYWDHALQLTNSGADHSLAAMLFELPPDGGNVIGQAGGDFRDASQAYVLAQLPPGSNTGHSSVIVHEAGHHLGLSHPHDGFDVDPIRGVILSIAPTGRFHFAWTGVQVATVMSYAELSKGFSQFDLDSMARWTAVAYLNQANQVLDVIYGSEKARQEDAAVIAADQRAFLALVAYRRMDYQLAAQFAKQAYEGLLAAADRLRIPIEPQAREADLKARAPSRFFVDPADPFNQQGPQQQSSLLSADLPALPAGPVGWHYPER